MRGLVCALAIAATLCLAAASPVPFGVNSPVSSSTPEAWLIKASKFQAEHWLREHHDVRGFVADMVLVFARPGERLPATSSTRTSLGPVKEGERLAILEPVRSPLRVLFVWDVGAFQRDYKLPLSTID